VQLQIAKTPQKHSIIFIALFADPFPTHTQKKTGSRDYLEWLLVLSKGLLIGVDRAICLPDLSRWDLFYGTERNGTE